MSRFVGDTPRSLHPSIPKRDIETEVAHCVGGVVTLYCDGEPVGQGRVEQTQPMAFSADEACDVGSDTGSPASPDYGPTGNRFTGEIDWVQIDIGDDNHDHLITPEELMRVATTFQ